MKIYFEESLPDGPMDYSLLLLHSNEQCCDMWTRGGVLDSLASHGHRAVAIDLPGSGRSKPSNGTGPSTLDQMSNLLHSVIEQLTLDKVILVADGCSATYVIDYMGKCAEGDAADIIGCVLCNPDFNQLKSDGILDQTWSNDEMPLLLMSDDQNPNIIPSLEALQDLAEIALDSKREIKDKQPMSLQHPRAFVETILTFISRLQPVSV